MVNSTFITDVIVIYVFLTLTKNFNTNRDRFYSTGILHCKRVLSTVISVTELDNSKGTPIGVLQGNLLTEFQFLFSLRPEDFGIRFASNSSIKHKI